MRRVQDHDVEALARPEVRAQLSFGQLLRLYLDPFALFRSVTVGDPRAQEQALQYNRSHRRILLSYARRWAMIAITCIASAAPLGALAGSDPVLAVPLIGLELGFSVAVCVLLLALAVYVLLGFDDRDA